MRDSVLSPSVVVGGLGLLFCLVNACGHKEPPGSEGGARGGDTGATTGGAASAVGGTGSPGAGGSGNPGGNGSPGAGGSGSPGAGGSGSPGAGGSGSPGGNSSSGGSEVVVDGGRAGAPVVTKMSCTDKAYSDAFIKPYVQDPAVLTQVQNTVASMSAKEKADQMRGTPPGSNNQNFSDIFRTPDDTARGIKGFRFRDGPRGVNLAAEKVGNGYSTSFPSPIARGAAFDLDLERRIGLAIGDETLASGNTMMLSPTVNILRHPAWGRAQETYGEDVYLLGRMGSAHVVGVQEFVPACVKHYAANNIENQRASLNAQMDEQTLREIYARHFEMIIEDGGVACVMAAYNSVNGAKSTQSKHLLTDILRTDFGFKGFVLSDWWAMPGGSAMTNADTLKTNAAEAIQAGMDMELPWNLTYQYIESITGGTLPQAAVNTSVSRILEQKYRFKVDKLSGALGLKTPTTGFSNGSVTNNTAHIALAEEAALKSITLLKNEGNTLPIKRDTAKNIAVLGLSVSFTLNSTDIENGTVNFAEDVRTGDLGSSRVIHDPSKAVGPLAGIRAAAGAGITVTSGNSAAAAANADFIVVVAGLTAQDEGEEYTGAGDRPNFLLDGKKADKAQNKLIADAAALGKPMVVVLEGGSVIEMPWLSSVKAVVMAWYPGQQGGNALGKLLFGDANFGGKLPITWPTTWDQFPAFNAGATTTMDYDLGYRHFDRKALKPLYAFGYGLSYTTFEYGNLQVPCSDVTKNGVIDVKVDITNKGAVKGDEIAFLFVSYPGRTARRPIKELKGFYRVTLDPNQTKQITIPVRVSDLKHWDMTTSAWVVDSGAIEIQVGGASDKLTLKDTVTIK